MMCKIISSIPLNVGYILIKTIFALNVNFDLYYIYPDVMSAVLLLRDLLVLLVPQVSPVAPAPR